MPVFSVSLVLHTHTHTLEEICAVVGAEPTSWKPVGERISRFMPKDRLRTHSTAVFDAAGVAESPDVESSMVQLRPLLLSLAEHEPFADAEIYLSIGVRAPGNGFGVWLSPEDLALLSAARCPLWVDSYSDDTLLGLAKLKFLGLWWGRPGQRRKRSQRRAEQLAKYE